MSKNENELHLNQGTQPPCSSPITLASEPITHHPSLITQAAKPITHHPSLALLRLFQLVSPALPVGAYHFSQGLEYAVHANWVHNETTASDWISGLAQHSIGTLDAPLLIRLHDAWSDRDVIRVERWSGYLIACRESMELRAEDRHMGKALAKVLVELEIESARSWITSRNTSYAAMFALAATHWQIDRDSTVHAYLWGWIENQVLAALKLLPIGQSSGQRILNKLLPLIPIIAQQASNAIDDDIGIATPTQGLASSWHETQYSRLFRS